MNRRLAAEPDDDLHIGFDDWTGAWSATTPRDASEIVRWQLDRAWEVVQGVVQANPFYRPRLTMPAARDSASYRSIPATTKQDVVADGDENPPYGSRTVAEFSDIRMVVQTSGTSGLGTATYALDTSDLEAIIRTEAVGFLWAGIGQGTRVLLTLPIGLSAAGLWYSAALRSIGANVLSVGPYSTERKVQLLQRFEAEVVIGTPSYVQRLAVACEDSGVAPDETSVRTLIVAGQPFQAPWAIAMERRWGATLFEQYGCTERAIAWTCPGGVLKDGTLGVLHFPPESGYYEVIDPESGDPVGHGETGELIITPFGADASPLVRYATGDRVRWMAPGSCACRRPLAGIAAGEVERYDDMMKIRGVNVWPAAFDRAVFSVDAVTDYRGTVRIDHDGSERIEIRAEGNGESGELAEALSASIRRITGLGAEVRIVTPGTLAREVPEGFVKIKRFQIERLR
jgi:phenylacetate-CoA ligase